MSLLIKPTTACNLSCEYCYEADIRNAGNHKIPYDLEAMKAAILADYNQTNRNGTPVLHGGEITLLPIGDVEELCALVHRLYGRVAIQTNGTLITDDLIRLFKKYNVSVGISVDGPGDLNASRWAGSQEATRRMTERIHHNMFRLVNEGINVGLIVVINKLHLKPENMQAMKDWVLHLQAHGIKGGRMNFVQVDYPEVRDRYELTADEASEFYKEMVDFFFSHPDLFWQPFRDIADNLMGFGMGTCFYTQCDVFATNGARIVQHDGSIGNCMKIARNDGVTDLYSGKEDHYRSELLRQVPHEYGGCNGCRWWRICHGHCPTEGFDFDWRSKSRYCVAYKTLYSETYNRLKAAIPNLDLVVDDEINKRIIEPGICGPEESEILERDYRERAAKRHKSPFARMLPGDSTDLSTWSGTRPAKADQSASSREGQYAPHRTQAHDSCHMDHADHADTGPS